MDHHHVPKQDNWKPPNWSYKPRFCRQSGQRKGGNCTQRMPCLAPGFSDLRKHIGQNGRIITGDFFVDNGLQIPTSNLGKGAGSYHALSFNLRNKGYGQSVKEPQDFWGHRSHHKRMSNGRSRRPFPPSNLKTTQESTKNLTQDRIEQQDHATITGSFGASQSPK